MIRSTLFRHKKTGEIKRLIPVLDINSFEKIEEKEVEELYGFYVDSTEAPETIDKWVSGFE